MDSNQQPKASRAAGDRVAIAMISWLFAGIGILSSLMFAGAGVFSDSASGILATIPLLAWCALGVMTFCWIQNRYCHWLWLIVGSITGSISINMFASFCLFYFSAVPLAVYLVFWHLRGNMRSKDFT